ncbi:hypothetical protein BADSM9389_17120 [Buttiauxella agrestis]|nr:hypothetical protein BADSM9389_17120 [Buttiauxella agrestis]
MVMLNATPGVQASASEVLGINALLAVPLSTPLWLPKFNVPNKPPLPLATEHPGVIVAPTWNDCWVTALAGSVTIIPKSQA